MTKVMSNNKIDIDKVARIVDEIETSKNISTNIDTVMLHLIEEVGELSREIINERLKRKAFNIKKFEEELSDCIIMLLILAARYNIKLEDVILGKLNKLRGKENDQVNFLDI